MNDPLAMAWAGIVATGTVLSSRGLAPGSSGNLSVRQGDRIVITPTGTELYKLALRRAADGGTNNGRTYERSSQSAGSGVRG